MKIILPIFFLLTLLLLADILLYYFADISLAGYYSDVILFWLWFISSISVIINYWKKRSAKIFLGAMISALLLSILPLAMPFFSFVLSVSPAGLYDHKDLNENYRFQIVRDNAMARPHLEIIEKMGILEQRKIILTDLDMIDLYPGFRLSNTKEIFLISEGESTLRLGISNHNSTVKVTFDQNSGAIITLK